MKENDKKLEIKKAFIKLTFFQIVLPSCCYKKKNQNMIYYNNVKSYILKQISIKEILRRNNDVDKIKSFVFDNDLISIYQNCPNPSLIHVKEDTRDLWLQTFYNPSALDVVSLEEKIHHIRNKFEKNILEKNCLNVYDKMSLSH